MRGARELSDPAQRESALRGVLGVCAGTDPQGAAAASSRENATRADGRQMAQVAGHQHELDKDLAGGVASAATLPTTTQNRPFREFYHSALHQNKTAGMFSILESLPADQRQTLVGNCAVKSINSWSPSIDEKYLASPGQMPAPLRNIARRAVEATDPGSGVDRRQKILDALKQAVARRYPAVLREKLRAWAGMGLRNPVCLFGRSAVVLFCSAYGIRHHRRPR